MTDDELLNKALVTEDRTMFWFLVGLASRAFTPVEVTGLHALSCIEERDVAYTQAMEIVRRHIHGG
jgi:hypothetical protein